MRIVATLVLLLAMLAGEVLLARLTHHGALLPLYGVFMALIVAILFMRLARMPGLAIIAGLAGLFWLCVMLGLGMVDPMTRHDVTTPPGNAVVGSENF